MYKLISMNAPPLPILCQMPGTSILLVNSLHGFGEEGNVYLGIHKDLPQVKSQCLFMIKAHLDLSEFQDGSDHDSDKSNDSSEGRPDPNITQSVYRALVTIPAHSGLNLPVAFIENTLSKTILDQLQQPTADDYETEEAIKPPVKFFTIYPRMQDSINHGNPLDWVNAIPNLNTSINQLFSALEHLNTHKILYKDFATRNILYCPDKGLQLCDFGCSTLVETGTVTSEETQMQKMELNTLLLDHVINNLLRLCTNFPVENTTRKGGNFGQKRKAEPYNFSQDKLAKKLIEVVELLMQKPLSEETRKLGNNVLTAIL